MTHRQLEIIDEKKVWAVWVNTDTTEGRGYEYPCKVCFSQETAHRLGKGINVQGSNAIITEETAIKFKGNKFWHIPGRIEPETKFDYAKRLRREAKEEKQRPIIEKAMAAGLTDDDIKIIQG